MNTSALRTRSLTALVVCSAAAFGTVACGGTIEFKDKSALTIEAQGEKPAPKKEKKRVEVKADKLEITEKIQFEKGAAAILSASHELLNEIVDTLKENPQIEKLAIEGHTSSEGNLDFNRALSKNRAKAVLDYLVSHGIAAARLEATGYGPDKPLAKNDTEENREKNRRVEFNIKKTSSK